jgi:hypothetical protein
MVGTYADRFFTIIEKALIPMAVALIAFFGNHAAQSLTKSQMDLAARTAEDGAKSRREEFEQTMQAKYLEMFHADLASGDKQRQTSAIQLLYYMHPQLAESLSKAMASDPDTSPALRDKVQVVARTIEAAQQLTRFKVGIYFPLEDDAARAKAEAIQKSLAASRVAREVVLYARSRQTLANWVAANALEVRFEDGTESVAADQLVDALAAAPLQLAATKLAVGTRTEGFISVMVPVGG